MTTPTADDIWAILHEVAQSQKETDLKFQETDQMIKDLFASQKETSQMAKDLFASQKETDRLFRASERKLNKLEDLFTSQWGKLMESLVEGDLVNILNQHGLAIGDTTTRLKGKRPDGGNFEFDIVAHNGHEIVVIEVKTTLRPEDVKKFIGKLDRIKTWLPRYANQTIYGGMAWLTAVAGAEEMLENRGLFSIRATGDSAAIVNSRSFQPRAW